MSTTPQDPNRAQLAADIARLDADWNEITGDWSPLASEYLKWMAEELAAAGYRKTPVVDVTASLERALNYLRHSKYAEESGRIWAAIEELENTRAALSRDIGGQP